MRVDLILDKILNIMVLPYSDKMAFCSSSTQTVQKVEYQVEQVLQTNNHQSPSPLPDETQLLPQHYMASGLEVKLYRERADYEICLYKHNTRVKHFRLLLI